MKRFLAVLFFFVFLTGCASTDDAMDNAMGLRKKISNSENCSFECTVTADYADKIFSFVLKCIFDGQGGMKFTVLEPESISGITGNVDSSGGNLTFDDQVLMFPMLADGYISPVCAPWLLVKSLRGAYIHSAIDTEEGAHIVCHDSFGEETLQMEIWADDSGNPKDAEILWKGRRILTLAVRNFACV